MLLRKILRRTEEGRHGSLVALFKIVDELINRRLLGLGESLDPLNQFRSAPHVSIVALDKSPAEADRQPYPPYFDSFGFFPADLIFMKRFSKSNQNGAPSDTAAIVINQPGT